MSTNNKENNRNLSYPTLEEIHDKLLKMLKAFHQICVDNQIRYYIIGGTALGARRHQGFIPWDDDVDVGMPRPDYERFASLAMEKLPPNYELKWYRNTAYSPFQFIKFIDNQTTLIEKRYTDYVEGLYIDVFPLDGVGAKGFFERLRRERIWALHSMVCVKCSTLSYNSLIKCIVAKFIKLFDLEALHNKLEKAVTIKDFDSAKIIGNYFGSHREKELTEKRVFGVPNLYKFEDSEFYGPEHIDEYLTIVYGDYMTPPPPEERTARHDYLYLNFNLPYREYVERLKRYNNAEKYNRPESY